MPYYIVNGKEFMDSSHRIDDAGAVEINEVQYAITRLIVRGYSFEEVHRAVDEVSGIMKQHAERTVCPSCGQPRSSLSSVCLNVDCDA